MATIIFDCYVQEYHCVTHDENNENSFAISDKGVVINFMGNEKPLMQSEISKEDAIKLAKLILFTYE